MRPSGRTKQQTRPIDIKPNFSRHAEGSALIMVGNTEVLCTASVEERVPPFLRGQGEGWITAEYGMLPRATNTRNKREAARGKQSGRTQEIQRLIGRSLRSVVDLQALGERCITLDCDVLNADGGTRCASITGAWVALRLALETLKREKILKTIPLTDQIAAISCGLTKDGAVADLDYAEDSHAYADVNFVLTPQHKIVEIQGTAESEPFSQEAFNELFELARNGITQLAEAQTQALKKASINVSS